MEPFNFVMAAEVREALKKLSWWQKWLMLNFGKKIYIGHEGHELHKGWTGKLPFYLFRCENCEKVVKDYPHSYPERQYLLCLHCMAHHDFVPWWVPFHQIWEIITFVIMYRKEGKRRSD